MFPTLELKKEFLSALAIRTLGNFMVLSCLFLIIKTVYQPTLEEVRFFYNSITNKTFAVQEQKPNSTSQQTTGGFGSFFQGKKVEVMVPEDPEFSLVIPKIGANAPVVANVDPSNEPEYQEALKHGIAHAKGTSFPGNGGNTFLFAHSTDYIWNIGSYNAVFYLLYKMEIGDEVNVFYKGQRYVYEVNEKSIIEPYQVEYLTRTPDEEILTLQTCWPPGTTLKRLIVVAVRKSN